MTDVMEELEGGLPRQGHRAEDGPRGPVVRGEARSRSHVSGENWGRKPDDWVYREATAVAVDSRDRVYVFNRGTKPMIVYDADGTMVDSWDWKQGGFKNTHGGK